MDLAEALAELGLAPAGPHDQATIRRAYLKGVKVRKPETDPEGFRRLREAYELLRVFGPGLAYPAPTSAPDTAHAPDSPRSPATPADPAADATADELPGDDRGDDTGADPVTPYLDRLDALPAQPWPDRLAVAREAFAALPHHPRVEELLDDILAASQARTDQVVEVLVPLLNQGDPASRWLMLSRYQKHVPLDELARLRREGSPGERLAAAEAYLEQERADDAVATMEELLASDKDRGGGLLLQYQALRFTLALHRRALVPQASRAFAAARAYMGTIGGPQLGEAASATASLYLLCSELEAVPDLPRAFRADVALGVLQGDLGVTAYTVRGYQRMHGARDTRRWQRRLKKDAPTIASLLQWTEPEARAESSRWNHSWWIAVALIAIVRFIGNQSSRGPTQASNYQYELTSPITTATPAEVTDVPIMAICDWSTNPLLRTPNDQPEGQQMRRAIEAVCPKLQTLSRTLEASDCVAVRATLSDLRLLRQTLPVTVASHIDLITPRVNAQCPP
jgi:hypothetical protein